MEEKECTLVKVLKLVETEELGKRSVRDIRTHFKLQKKTDSEEKAVWQEFQDLWKVGQSLQRESRGGTCVAIKGT